MTAKPRLTTSLKAAGVKLTIQRIAICDWLESSTEHPRVADVYDALHPQYPTMSLATVYNTLKLLTDLQLITELGSVSDGSTRFDTSLTPHINLTCRECSEVIDGDGFDDHFIRQAAGEKGFHLLNGPITAYGICSNCMDTTVIA